MNVRRVANTLQLVAAMAALTWGLDPAGAQAPLYPPGIGFNPAVNYYNVNWSQSPNLHKFVDSLPGLGAAHKNNLGQFIPVAVPDTTTYPGSDFYSIAASQYSVKMHSDLPATTLRGYKQTNWADPNTNVYQYLGPCIIAREYDPNKPAGVNGNGKPVRVLFSNQLPLVSAGKFFLPVDTTIMGAGMGPTTGMNYTHNRLSIPHLHGGRTPWISDGTPHQWVTPAGETTPYQKGASFVNVPDMVGAGKSIPTPAAGDGLATLYWTNEQSGRLMFFHDHAYGTTRLNVYAGVAAPYLLVSQVEDDLISGTNVTGGNTVGKQVLPDGNDLDASGLYRYGIPLVIQDKSYVNAVATPPADFPTPNYTPTAMTALTDPLWASYVGTGGGNLWIGHEYLPIENIYDPTGNNWNGRWDYGPFMIPPGLPTNLTLPSPTLIPEAFCDTAVVNGTAFPYVELPPEAVRFRILGVCNDRALNLQLYKADPLRVNVTNGGTGYVNPVVTITGNAGVYTTATANVSKGEIGSINIVGARGYQFPPTITITDANGGAGTATVNSYIQYNTTGFLTVTVTSSQGWTAGSKPVVTVTGGGGGIYDANLTTATVIPPGVIKSVDVTGEANYRSDMPVPVVTITDANGGPGTGAAAVAVVNKEVKMVDAAPNPQYPNWPKDGRDGGVPDPTTQGPPWIHIGNEGGFLAQAAVIPPQPIDFEYNRQSIPFAGVTSHCLLLFPAQRADVVVDFSQYKDGDVLILYNDSPAPIPLPWPINDYYTDDPDQTGVGAQPSTPAGFGPNTRTLMQIRIKGTKTTAFNFDANALIAAIPGAFAKDQDKPLVPQLAYNKAYPGFATTDTFAQSVDSTLNLSGAPGPITRIKTTAPGNNYAVAPNVMIVGGSGSGATATAGLNPCGGITLLTTGSGYTTPPVVTIGPPGAGGVQATAVATISGGQVQAITIDEPGSNYSTATAPTVTIAAPTGAGGVTATASSFVAVANTVGSITVTNGGSGYTHEPVVYITPAAGSNGMGAAAVALINGAMPMTTKSITEGFDPDYGRMDIRMGSTPNPLTPSVGAGMVMGLARYIDPPTEILVDGNVTLWRITHLGVDSHALHVHLFDVQVVNRVDYTNVIKPPYWDEVGWRDTIRTNPMEDLIVAFRPHSMVLPFVIPNSNRLLDPTTPLNSTTNFLPVAPPAGVAAVAQTSNVMTNFGWEYVWHCHMLGHEENDFMRPMCLTVVPPVAPTGLTAAAFTGTPNLGVNLAWNFTGNANTAFTIQRATNTGFTTNLVTLNPGSAKAYADSNSGLVGNTTYYYRVQAFNGAGTSAWSNTATLRTPSGPLPGSLSNLQVITAAVGQTVVPLTWTNNLTGLVGVTIQRATNPGFTTGLVTVNVNTPTLTGYTFTGLARGTLYYFRVAARTAAGTGPYTPVPPATVSTTTLP